VSWSLGECSNVFSLDFGQLVVVRDTVVHHRADNWKKRSVFHSATFHSRLHISTKTTTTVITIENLYSTSKIDKVNQTVNDGVAHSKNPRKCAYDVTFDLDLGLTLSIPWMHADQESIL